MIGAKGGSESAYPEGRDQSSFVQGRQRRGLVWRVIFQFSTIIGIVALVALLYNVLNSAFGYVAIQNKRDPEVLLRDYLAGQGTDAELGALDEGGGGLAGGLSRLSKVALVDILQSNVSVGLIRRFESEKPIAERTREEVLLLVMERVVEPKIVRSWSLADSLTKRVEIAAEAQKIAGARLEFRSWLNGNLLGSPQSSKPEFAGVRTAILGSLWTILITILFALPVGIAAAVYLEEYAHDNWLNRVISTNISNLAGVPSIIYGMLGLAIFVRVLERYTSGAFLGVTDPTTANGRTVVAAGLTLALLILPLIIINAQEAIRAVPSSLRHASYGLGATKLQTVWHHVLPNAIPGILTGAILAVSRAIGETAPLVVIGASTFIVVDPDGPFSKFTTLPIQIYQWTARPQPEFRNLAAAAILVLLIMLLSLNASAIVLRNRYSRKV